MTGKEMMEREAKLLADLIAERNSLREQVKTLQEQLSQQEDPVAVWELQSDGWETICDGDWLKTLPLGTKLYTHPPRREWVGLTDDEIAEIDKVETKYIGTGEYVIDGEYEFARDIEAMLRSKNGYRI